MGRCHSINKVSPKRRRRACASPCVFLSGGGREGEEGALGCTASGVCSRGDVCCAAVRSPRRIVARSCRNHQAGEVAPPLRPFSGCLRGHGGDWNAGAGQVHTRPWPLPSRPAPCRFGSDVNLCPQKFTCICAQWCFGGGDKDVRPFVLLLCLKLKGFSLFFFLFFNLNCYAATWGDKE